MPTLNEHGRQMCARLWVDEGSVMGSMSEDPVDWSKWGPRLLFPYSLSLR